MSTPAINHLAVVVEDIDGALAFWRDALGLPLAGVESVPAEEVRVAFLEAGTAHVELVQPTTPASGVARYLEKRGPGMHHICLEVADLDAAIAQMLAHDIEMINDVARTRDNGQRYAFVHPRSTGGVMVELYERAGADNAV
jgi:methylmalonyl-CoA/ethylmalonyl-CoA epimerase